MWREKCCESTFTQIPRFSLLSQLQTQQSFSQTSLNSSIIRIQTQKHNFKINQIIKKKSKKKGRKKKTEDRSHLTHLDCVGDEDEQWLQAGPTALG